MKEGYHRSNSCQTLVQNSSFNILVIKSYYCTYDSYLNHMEFVSEFSQQMLEDCPLKPVCILQQVPSHFQYLHPWSFRGRIAVLFRVEVDSGGEGIFSLTTSSSQTKVTSTAGVSFLFFPATSCFWVPLNLFFLFEVLFLKTDCFLPTFGIIYRREDK